MVGQMMYVQMDRSERTVRVSGMSYLMDCDFIYDLFTEMGPVEKVILREHPDGTPKDALVVFRNKASVAEAIKNLHKREVYGALLIVRRLRSGAHRGYGNINAVFVTVGGNGGATFSTTPQDFANGSANNTQLFSQGGRIRNSRLGVSRSAEVIGVNSAH